ncbi:hypothetical protein V5F29_19030 [Xanthobacter aminoxidans]|uniref:hypothetical protein n=1 Tax=Xanthobacter aminoxidans TaxID=186280 RepID=UPI0037269C10
MRACAAACAAFFLMALAPPATRALAQCGSEAPAPAGVQPAVPAKPPPLHAYHPPSEAGTIALPSAPLARAASVTATQMPDEAAALPGAIAPRAYRPYQIAPAGPLPLTAETVAPSLEARGFRQIGAVRQRGQSFLAEATGPRGERVRLVLDAASGDISGMQVIGSGAPR